ncbi:13330_t:CDS:2, partial [Racocetra fulgida]
WEKWMDEEKGGFTKKENCKKASYELVCDTDLLARSFEASGLTLNPDGSEDDKMTSRLQAIIANRMNEVYFSMEEDNEPANQDNVDNESNPDILYEFDGESVMDDYPEEMDTDDDPDEMDFDY